MSLVKKISFGNGQLNQFMIRPSQIGQPSNPVATASNTQSQTKTDTSAKTIAYVSSAVALASLGVSTAIAIKSGKKGKNFEKSGDEFLNVLSSKLEQGLKSVRDDVADLRAKSDFDMKLDGRFKGYEDWIKVIENKIKETGEWHDNWLKDIERIANEKGDFSVGWLKTLEERLNSVANRVGDLSGTERNLVKIDNFNLLQNLGPDGQRIGLPQKVIQEVREAASKMIHKGSEIPKLDPKATTWSLTAESLPEKEGGLGEVPVQMAKNMTKELGINNYLLRPLNEIPGVSTLVAKDGKYHYRYKTFDLDLAKIIEFDTYAFRNGRTEKQTVEVFYGVDPKGFKRLMFKNKDFFLANGLYKDSQISSEKERYAFFPKAVYEFAKIKSDPKAATSYNIFNEEIYNEIQAPDTLLLNDWHTSAMAGLMKLLAPVEAAMGELSKTTAEKFKKMNCLEIIHNADYQGQDWMHAGDIINTLFGKYAYDIYTNAETGLNPDGLKKVLNIDGTINLANIAASLANKLKPVSRTYSQELAEQFERSKSLQHIYQVRLAEGTMEGHSNGWDRIVNEISADNLPVFNNNVNADKFKILRETIDNIPSLQVGQRESIQAVFKDLKDEIITSINFEPMLKALKELGIPKLDNVLAKLEADGITTLRQFKVATRIDDIDTIMEARKHNKRQFLDFIRSMADYNKNSGKLFNLADEGVTDLSKVDMDDLDNQVVLNCGTRFVGQKGIDILVETIKQINKEWPQKYPGKPKPVWAIGGADGESGQWEALVKNFKKEMGKDGDTIPYWVGYTPNNVFHGGSDITLYPSHFEPDGSKWESLYRGTPVVATRVGGHVDSIIDGFNGFLTKRTVPEVVESGYDYLGTMAFDFKEAIYRSIDAFYDKKVWKELVRHSIDGDQSWLIKDKDGKIVGGALLGHLEDLGYNLDDFPTIANSNVRKAFAESKKFVTTAVEDKVATAEPKPKKTRRAAASGTSKPSRAKKKKTPPSMSEKI